jgi:hypothetical protein
MDNFDYIMSGSSDYDDETLSPSRADYKERSPSSPRRKKSSIVTLSSKTYPKTLSNRLGRFLAASEYCDVTLRTGNSTFRAHKVILAANSDYFNAMFATHWDKGSDNVKVLEGITPTGLDTLMRFAYTGSFDIQESTMVEILEAAQHCLMPEMTKLCEEYLTAQITKDNYVDLFKFALRFNLKNLFNSCDYFFERGSGDISLRNYLEFLDYAKFRNSEAILTKVSAFIIKNVTHSIQNSPFLVLSISDAIDTVGLSDISEQLNSEDLRHIIAVANRNGVVITVGFVRFLISWLCTDKENRVQYLPGLFEAINLTILTAEELEEIASMPFISEDKGCLAHLRETREYIACLSTNPANGDPFLVAVSSSDITFIGLNSQVTVTQKDLANIPCLRRLQYLGEQQPRKPSLAVVDNILYICGMCHRNDSVVNYFHSFNPIRDQWKNLADLPVAKFSDKLLGLSDKLYSIAGVHVGLGLKKTDRVDVYDISSNTWTTTSPIPHSVPQPFAAALDGHIYLNFIGLDTYTRAFTECFEDFVRFDPLTGTWEERAPLQGVASLRCIDMVTSRDRLFVFGEDITFADKDNNRIDTYDPTVDQWTTSKKEFPFYTFCSSVDVRILASKDYIYSVSYDSVKVEDERTSVFLFDPTSFEFVKQDSNCRIKLGKSFYMSAGTALVYIPNRMLKYMKSSFPNPALRQTEPFRYGAERHIARKHIFTLAKKK